MFQVGRICYKIAGRDAGKKCVIVEVLDKKFVMIDGETRRRKCNMLHLEPTQETVDVKKGASRADVVSAFSKLGIELKDSKPREAKPKPKQIRSADRKKMAPKPAKKETKKEKPKVAEVKQEEKAEPKVEAELKVEKQE